MSPDCSLHPELVLGPRMLQEQTFPPSVILSEAKDLFKPRVDPERSLDKLEMTAACSFNKAPGNALLFTAQFTTD